MSEYWTEQAKTEYKSWAEIDPHMNQYTMFWIWIIIAEKTSSIRSDNYNFK